MSKPCRTIRTPRGESFPRRLVIIDTQAMPLASQGSKELEALVFQSCYMSHSTFDSNGIVNSVFSHHESAATTIASILNMVTQANDTWLIGYRIGLQLTLLDFWRVLAGTDWKVDYAVLDDPPTSISITTPGGTLKIADSLNYFKCSPLQILDYSGIDGEALSYVTDGPSRTEEQSSNMRDSLSRIFCHLIASIATDRWGKWAGTAAGLAWNCYTSNFMDYPITLHGNEEVTLSERAALFGGDVRCNFIGDPETYLYALDFNGLYPSVMSDFMFPCKYLKTYVDPKVQDVDKICVDGIGLAYAKLSSNSRLYPHRNKEGVRFTTGTFDTMLCGEELRGAIRRSHIIKPRIVHTYEKKQLFVSYIDHWYKLRLQNRQADCVLGELLCKTMANSLFGKFGQKSSRYVRDEKIQAPEAYGSFIHADSRNGTHTKCLSVAWQTFRSVPSVEWVHAFPAIAACVTAAGRERIGEAIRIAGVQNVYYQNTDALHTDTEGIGKLHKALLVRPQTLGRLKVVGTSHATRYWGPYDYVFDSRHVVSTQNRSTEQVSEGEFEDTVTQALPGILHGMPEPQYNVRKQRVRIDSHRDNPLAPQDGWQELPKLMEYPS